MTPAPVGRGRDASALQRQRHRNGHPLGQLLKLYDFGGDLHNPTVCTRARLSTHDACIGEQCTEAQNDARLPAMGSNAPKSLLDRNYREMAATFLESVMDRRKIKKAALARALGVDRSVASRYLSRDVRPPLQRLQYLQRTIGIEVPGPLVEAFWASESTTSPMPGDDARFAADLTKRLGDALVAATADERADLKQQLETLLQKIA